MQSQEETSKFKHPIVVSLGSNMLEVETCGIYYLHSNMIALSYYGTIICRYHAY